MLPLLYFTVGMMISWWQVVLFNALCIAVRQLQLQLENKNQTLARWGAQQVDGDGKVS